MGIENYSTFTSVGLFFGPEVESLARLWFSLIQNPSMLHLQSPRCHIEIRYDAAEDEILKALCDGDAEQAKNMKAVLSISNKGVLQFALCLLVAKM